jgi:hypothetical protein
MINVIQSGNPPYDHRYFRSVQQNSHFISVFEKEETPPCIDKYGYDLEFKVIVLKKIDIAVPINNDHLQKSVVDCLFGEWTNGWLFHRWCEHECIEITIYVANYDSINKFLKNYNYNYIKTRTEMFTRSIFS